MPSSNCARRGTTVVFSTHDMATAERMCDRIFMIFRGRKVLDGTLESIQNDYGADTVRIRTSEGAAALDRHAGRRSGQRFRADPGSPAEWRPAGVSQSLGGAHVGLSVRSHAAVAAGHFRSDRQAVAPAPCTRPDRRAIGVRHARAEQGVSHQPRSHAGRDGASVMLVRATKDAKDTKDRTFALVDYTGVVAEPLKALADMYNGGAPSAMDAVLPRNGAHLFRSRSRPRGGIPNSSASICRTGFAPKSSTRCNWNEEQGNTHRENSSARTRFDRSRRS